MPDKEDDAVADAEPVGRDRVDSEGSAESTPADASVGHGPEGVGTSIRTLRRLVIACGASALTALVAMFLPWHEVQDSGFGAAVACLAVMKDRCPAVDEPRAWNTEVGVHHGGSLAAMFLILSVAGMLGFAGWLTTRGTCLAAGLWAFTAGSIAGVVVFIGSDLSHMFEKTRPLIGETLFWLSLAGTIVVAGLICVVAATRPWPRLPRATTSLPSRAPRAGS